MKFVRKNEAVKYLKKKTKNDKLKLFQEDIDDDYKKYFLVITNDKLYDKIKHNQRKKSNSCYYESWLEDSKLNFSLDIDINKNINKINLDDIIIHNIKNIIR